MVKENHLGVVITFNFFAVSSVAWLLGWVDVDDFAVPLVAEQETFVRVCVYPKVW